MLVRDQAQHHDDAVCLQNDVREREAVLSRLPLVALRPGPGESVPATRQMEARRANASEIIGQSLQASVCRICAGWNRARRDRREKKVLARPFCAAARLSVRTGIISCL
jgi:hypothetical protein